MIVLINITILTSVGSNNPKQHSPHYQRLSLCDIPRTKRSSLEVSSLPTGKAASRLHPSAHFPNAVTPSRAGQAVLPGWLLRVWLDVPVGSFAPSPCPRCQPSPPSTQREQLGQPL